MKCCRIILLGLVTLSTVAMMGCDSAVEVQPTQDVEIEPIQLLDCPYPDPGRSCEYDHATLPGEFDDALAGNYQAQRNISYAFTSKSAWIVERPIQGCAWRMVIMATRPPTSTFDDAGMIQIQCANLSSRDRATAQEVANTIHRRIHGSDIPALPPIPAEN